VLGNAYPDAVTVWVDHGLEVAGRVDPVVDSMLSGVGCAGKYREVVAEAVRIAGGGSGLTLFLSMMPGIAPVRAGLGGVHQGITDRQF